MKMRGKRVAFVMLVLLMLLSAGVFIACKNAQTEQTGQSAGASETLPPVQIDMPEYSLTYSGALKDVIVHTVLEGENALKFQVKLSKSEEHIFTMYYDSTEGDFVTVLTDADGNKVPVAFWMAELPEHLTQEDKNVYLTAQEAVNEIAASLVLKK